MITTTVECLEPEFLLGQIGASYRETLSGRCLVYRAELTDGRDVVVKLPLSGANPYNVNAYRTNLRELSHEAETLERTKHIRGLTKKLGVYDIKLPESGIFSQQPFNEKTFAIVKSYVKGSPMSRANPIRGKENWDFIEKAMKDLGNAGISGIDTNESNIIITPNGKPVIVDLGNFSLDGRSLIDEPEDVRSSKIKQKLDWLRTNYFVDN